MVVGWVVTRFLRSVAMSRFVWRTVLVCLLLVSVSDFSGMGLLVVDGFSRREEPVAKPRIVESQVERAPVGAMPVATFSVPTPDVQAVYWWPAVIWAVGFMVVLARLSTAHALLMVMRRYDRRVTDVVVLDDARRIATQFGMRRRVVLIEGINIVAPFAFGIFRPAIALPADFGSKFRTQEREAILAHELAHIAAGDPAWQLVANLVSAFMWWHPAVWLARRWMYDAAEMAADEAVATLENGPQTLAECLVAMARSVARPLWWGGVGVNGTDRRSNLRRRVERLLNLPEGGAFVASARRREVRLIAAVLSVLAAFLVSGFVQEKSGPSTSVDVWKQSPLAVMCGQIKGQKLQGPAKTDAVLDDARDLYELGKLSMALAKLQVVLKLEPDNQRALYYWKLVRAALDRNRRDRPQEENLDWNQPWLFPTDPPKRVRSTTPSHVLISPAPKLAPSASTPARAVPFFATSSLNASNGNGSSETNLYSKVFHLNEDALTEMLKKSGKDVSNAKMMHQSLREWFQSKGVDWSDPRKTVVFNNRTGLLLVRATLQDLESIDGAVEMLADSRPQIVLRGRVMELGPDADKLLQEFGIDLKTAQSWESQRGYDLIDALKKQPEVTVVATPAVTTIMGRTAAVETTNPLPAGRRHGVSITMLPNMSDDAFSIELTAILGKGTGEYHSPLPQARAVHAKISDHGTLSFVCEDPESSGKKELVLVTATLIDPVGNAIHTDQEIKDHGGR